MGVVIPIRSGSNSIAKSDTDLDLGVSSALVFLLIKLGRGHEAGNF